MKKIAIVADGWRRYINYAWISGCRQYIKEKKLDAQLYVFYAFGNFSKDEKYNQGEYNIITLPDFRQFDGIIVELTNVLKRKYARKIIDTRFLRFLCLRGFQDYILLVLIIIRP